ncbi:MAG: hypothetical protein M1822_000949 [Bathelium mastoideum]|nr:MAG: hypothetical protein M1822_000949 [Bathelium mastoideum]
MEPIWSSAALLRGQCQCGVLINLAALNQTTFNGDQTEAFIGGGVSVRAMVHAAYRNHARFATATCNCVGFLGATLGGGLTRTAGLYGMGVDQLLSAEIVTAFGDVRYVDGGDIDLWWALKGAAPNIGIVTSAVVKAYPILDADNIAWQGLLTFSDDKLEALISAINDLYLEPRMQIDFMMASQPNGTTRIGAIPFFLGNTSAGRVAFTSILDIGPLADGTQEYPYNMWNAFGDYACVPAGRKPAYGVSLNNLDPPTWRTVYEDFKVFLATNPEATNSAIFAENYPINSSTIQNGAGSFPWRDVKTHVAIYPWYANTSLDAAANAWGSTTRTLLRSTDGVQGHANYVNFAHGDESLNDIYGPNLPRLQTLKRQYDPYNRLNQWFPIH